MEYRFNHNLVVDNLYELNQVEGIDSMFATRKAVEEIKKLLKLDFILDSEGLRAIRNSVVMIYSAFSRGLDDAHNRMSAIVSVIDNVMFNRFGHV